MAAAVGDGHCGQQQRHQAGKAGILLRLVQRFAQRGPVLVEIADVLPGVEPRLQPGAKPGHLRRVPREQVPVPYSAAGLDDAGLLKVGLVDHHPRVEAVEVVAAVGLVGQHPAQPESGLPDGDLLTEFDAEGMEHPGLHPGLAAPGAVLHRLLGAVEFAGHPEAALQGVAVAHGLHRHQENVFTGARHREEPLGACGLDVQAGRLLAHRGVERPAAGHHQVAADDMLGIDRHAAADAVGEMADRGVAADGHHQGEQEYGQLAAAPLAPQEAGRQCQDLGRPHRRTVRPPARKGPCRPRFTRDTAARLPC